jgi:hypothetical protein
MNYFRLLLKGYDQSAPAWIVTNEGRQIGDGEYILDTELTDAQINAALAGTVDSVEISPLTAIEFEDISRAKLDFYAPKPIS